MLRVIQIVIIAASLLFTAFVRNPEYKNKLQSSIEYGIRKYTQLEKRLSEPNPHISEHLKIRPVVLRACIITDPVETVTDGTDVK